MVEMDDHIEVYVVGPKGRHEYTIILLHGTSTSGPEFGNSLMSFRFPRPVKGQERSGEERGGMSKDGQGEAAQCPTSTSAIKIPSMPDCAHSHAEESDLVTLQDLLPNVRWVFPSGRARWVTVLARRGYAWFDVHDFKDRTVGEEMQIDALKYSVIYLKELVERERALLESVSDNEGEKEKWKRGRVVIGGFSQGAAMAGILSLSGEIAMSNSGSNIAIGGLVLMSGWLPFRKQIQGAISSSRSLENVRDSLGLSASTSETRTGTTKPTSISGATSYIRTLLSLDIEEGDRIVYEFNAPVFMGHGGADEKVRVEWGMQMKDVFRDVVGEENVQRREYEGLGHWWCEEEIQDLVVWLGEGWERRKSE